MSLTPRHLEVLRGLLNGKSDPEIARELGISVNTVKRHNSAIYQDLGIHGRNDLLPLIVKTHTMVATGKAKAAAACNAESEFYE